jgi:hypothetical protein
VDLKGITDTSVSKEHTYFRAEDGGCMFLRNVTTQKTNIIFTAVRTSNLNNSFNSIKAITFSANAVAHRVLYTFG